MSGRIVLKDVILKHDVPVNTRYGVTHVLVFYNPKDNTTWVWKTSTLPPFAEHCTYSIEATDEGDYYISHVKDLYSDSPVPDKSEQPDGYKDAWDAIFKKEVD